MADLDLTLPTSAGTPIEPNSANLCVACLRNTYVKSTHFSLHALIRRTTELTSQKEYRNKVSQPIPYDFESDQCLHYLSASISFCRNCERFLSPPQAWTQAKPESQELLAICLKKLKGLNRVRLTEAHFIWTEPHSKRLRVSMTIQKEVSPSSTLLECI